MTEFSFILWVYFPVEMQPSAGNYLIAHSTTTVIMYHIWLCLKLLSAQRSLLLSEFFITGQEKSAVFR